MNLYRVQGGIEWWILDDDERHGETGEVSIDRRVLAPSEPDAIETVIGDAILTYDNGRWFSGPFVELLPETAKMAFVGAPMLPGMEGQR